MKQFKGKIGKLRGQFDNKCVHIMQQDVLQTDEICNMVRKHGIFHWQLEFPDAFTDQRPGFDLIVGNPPWEAVKPKDDEFFSRYDPHFRAYSNKQDKNTVKKNLLQTASIKASFDDYVQHIGEQSKFFKESGQYMMRGKG